MARERNLIRASLRAKENLNEFANILKNQQYNAVRPRVFEGTHHDSSTNELNRLEHVLAQHQERPPHPRVDLNNNIIEVDENNNEAHVENLNNILAVDENNNVVNQNIQENQYYIETPAFLPNVDSNFSLPQNNDDILQQLEEIQHQQNQVEEEEEEDDDDEDEEEEIMNKINLIRRKNSNQNLRLNSFVTIEKGPEQHQPLDLSDKNHFIESLGEENAFRYD